MFNTTTYEPYRERKSTIEKMLDNTNNKYILYPLITIISLYIIFIIHKRCTRQQRRIESLSSMSLMHYANNYSDDDHFISINQNNERGNTM